MKKPAAALLLGPLLLAALPTLAAQDLIAVAWTGQTYSVDSHSCASQVLGTGLFGQNALGVDGDGIFWSTARSASGNIQYLTRIDPVSGAATIVYNSVDLRGLAGANGNHLFGAEDVGFFDYLDDIDVTTGRVTTIGMTGLLYLQSLALHQGVLYGWDNLVGLVTIDQTTGVATDPFPQVLGPQGMQWMCSHPDGRLLVGHDDLYQVDPTTGVATWIGYIGNFDLRGVEMSTRWSRSFGQGCNGTAGSVSLSVISGLYAGMPFTATSNHHVANAIGACIVGTSTVSYAGNPLPFLLDPLFGTQHCTLYTSIDATLLGLSGASAPAALTFSFVLPASTAGLRLHLQHACFEPVSGGMSWSNAVTVQIQ